MQFIVAPIKPTDAMEMVRGLWNFSRTGAIKEFYTDKRGAVTAASALAQKNPGIQYGVFVIGEVIEALPAKLVHKMLNEAGEIVPVEK